MEKDGKRDIWEAFLEKLLAFKTAVENALKYAQIMTRTMAVITQQPVDVRGPLNSECFYEVVAENATQYRWQRGRNGTWSLLSLESAYTSKLEFAITEDRARYSYRCRITGVDGVYVYSNEVNMYIEEE